MSGQVTIRFLGAAGTVTGSKYLVEADGERLLVDCGMYQGRKELRLRNWAPLPVAPASIDHVVFTHAHIDHSGYAPRLLRDGYEGLYWGTSGTCDLLRVLLPDAAHLQQEQAEYSNRKGFTKHSPALPLFSAADAEGVLERLKTLPYRRPVQVGRRLSVEARGVGHILGASSLVVSVAREAGPPLRITFSGDVGRYEAPILRDPAPVEATDYLVIESTYGGRKHPSGEEAIEALATVVNESVARGGVLLVPAFAIGRTQTLLYVLRQLEDQKRIPRLPVYLDSPMAIQASEYYKRHPEDFDAETLRLQSHRAQPFAPDMLRYVASRKQSKKLNRIDRRAIIISASGMITGGRIMHHAAVRLPHEQNTLLVCGFQAEGTRGRRLLEGEPEIKIHGQPVPVRAHVAQLSGFSAHADEDELVRWTTALSEPPRRIFVTHGEPQGSTALAARLQAERGFETYIPTYEETVELD